MGFSAAFIRILLRRSLNMRIQFIFIFRMFDRFVIALILIATAISNDWSPIDKAISEGIQERAFPGAVVAVANKTHVLFEKAYGSLSYGPDIYRTPTTIDTKYDVASMTKIMATTLAIMNLVSSNSIKVEDLVSKYVEDYDTNKKGNTTIKNLLLHNAGLPYDYPGALPNTQKEVIDYIRYIKPVYTIGSKFQYSNLGFLLLSKIV